MDYKTRAKFEPDEKNMAYGIQVYNVSIPSPYISLELYDLALELKGEYGGWETMLVT